MRSNNKIYSLHIQPESSGLLQIETVIAGGIYNFSILGIANKYALDIKHKVYTALRASGVLNLKSDNRKITSNIIADKEDIVPTYAELATAISCISCIQGDIVESPLLALGGLSITGVIIPTNKMLQCIYLAIKHNIPYVLCSKQDIIHVNPEYLDHATKNNITFFVGETITELLSNMQTNTLYKMNPHTCGTAVAPSSTEIAATISTLKESHLLWAIFIALCGKHNLMIETNRSSYSEELIDMVGNCLLLPTVPQRLLLAHKTKLDGQLFDLAMQDSQYSKIPSYTLKKMPKNGLVQFTYLENILSLGIDVYAQYYTDVDHQIISTCQFCPCGHHGSSKKCCCIQRSILRYQHKLKTEHKPYYHMWVSHNSTGPNQLINNQDFGVVSHIIQTIQGTSTENLVCDIKAEKMYTQLAEGLGIHQRSSLLSLATTLQHLTNLEQPNQEKRPTRISTKNLLLAFSYLPKMDF